MLRETLDKLLQILARWDRRLRVQRSVTWVPRGIILALILALVIAFLARLYPVLLTEQLVAISTIMVVLAIIGVLVVIWLRDHDTLATARRFDGLFELRERVSTALEMSTGQIACPNDEIIERQLTDTVSRAEKIEPNAYMPLEIRWREIGIVLGLIIVLAILFTMENPQASALANQQALNTAIQQEVEALENLREQLARNEELSDDNREEMLDTLDEAIEQLTSEELSREEAVATLSELADEMQALAENEDNTDALTAEQQAALEQAAEELAEQAPEMADALQNRDGESLAEELGDLSEALQGMDEATQQDLAEALSMAAENMEAIDPELAQSLQEAAEALEQGDLDAAQDALEQASQDVQDETQQMQDLTQQDSGGMQTQTQQSGQQVASQAAQQVQQSTQRMAQPGQQNQQSGQQGNQQQTDSNSNDGPQRIQQGEGSENGQSVQTDQSGDGEQGSGQQGQESQQDGGEQAGGQSGNNESGQTEGQTSGASSGAGDSEGSGAEGGVEGSDEQIGADNDPDGTGEEEYAPIYAPQTINQEGNQSLQVSGSGEPGDTVTREGNLIESPDGESSVGYNEVFGDYANMANQAMERDYIPLGLRDVIREYFSALAP